MEYDPPVTSQEDQGLPSRVPQRDAEDSCCTERKSEHESQRARPEVTLPVAETMKNIVNLADNAPPRM